MGNKVSYVDTGLFVSGVAALEDVNALHELGITSILNLASEELYSQKGHELLPKLQAFTRKSVGLEDKETEDFHPHFKALSEFILRGREAGGIVVHCAGGISRAPTAVIGHLMLQDGLSLRAAFHRVHRDRVHILPNPGFWRQLRELEARLLSSGRQLRETVPGELLPFQLGNSRQLWEIVGGAETGGLMVRSSCDFSSEKLPARLAAGSVVMQTEHIGVRLRYRLLAGFGPYSGWISTESGDKVLARPADPDPVLANAVMHQLDILAAQRGGFEGIYLTARILLTDKVVCAATSAERLRETQLSSSLTWASVEASTTSPTIDVRVLVPHGAGLGRETVLAAAKKALGPGAVEAIDIEGTVEVGTTAQTPVPPPG